MSSGQAAAARVSPLMAAASGCRRRRSERTSPCWASATMARADSSRSRIFPESAPRRPRRRLPMRSAKSWRRSAGFGRFSRMTPSVPPPPALDARPASPLNHTPHAKSSRPERIDPMPTPFFGHAEIAHLLAAYGYLVVGVEGMGIPVPGETTLIAASIFAGTTQELNIALVVAAAGAGAVVGDNAGFWIGRSLGYRLLRRFGRYIWLTERRIMLGQYLCGRYGGALVFVGRFVALLRTLAPFIAGANRMPWRRFFPFNAAGGFTWATTYGAAAYFLGKEAHGVMGRAGLLVAVLGIVAVGAGWLFLKRNEERLVREAERPAPSDVT